jgi:hypothetical protein
MNISTFAAIFDSRPKYLVPAIQAFNVVLAQANAADLPFHHSTYDLVFQLPVNGLHVHFGFSVETAGSQGDSQCLEASRPYLLV